MCEETCSILCNLSAFGIVLPFLPLTPYIFIATEDVVVAHSQAHNPRAAVRLTPRIVAAKWNF